MGGTLYTYLPTLVVVATKILADSSNNPKILEI